MRKTQVSTNVGASAIIVAFLDIFGRATPSTILSVFSGLTIGEIATMVMPLLIGLWSIFHNETKGWGE